MRQLGLAALTCLELTPSDLVSTAAEAGYDYVGLRLIPVANQVLAPFDVRDIERRLRDTGVRVLDVEVFRLAPDTVVGDFERHVASASRLAAKELLVHGADPDEGRLVENFGRLCDLAARYRLNVSLEPMPWVEISNVRKAKRLLAAAGRANAALLVDAIHFFREDNRFDELEGVRANYAQLCDAHPGRPAEPRELMRQARSDRLFPGEGALDLQGLLAALPSGLPLSLEVPVAQPLPPMERARRALAATRRLLTSL